MASNLKIISGKYRGLTFDGDDILGTRPTMSRVKESLFAMIQDNVKNSICLDLFAGSGNLGLEALSNGAKTCYFIDNNKIAVDTINHNIEKLKINEDYYVMKKDYEEALKYFKNNNIKFDIIFLDPPYQLYLINNCLDKINKYDLLNPNGIVVCECETENVSNSDFKILKERTYGNKKVIIMKR